MPTDDGSRFTGRYPAYVPVAERRARAAEVARRGAKSGGAEPVPPIQGRELARTFWGQGWCARFESFRDFETRLPRGRSYARNGSVVDLKLTPGRVDARVVGSQPEPYEIAVTVKTMPPERWRALARATAGKIGSLIGLLAGELSPDVLAVLTRPGDGLYPEPGELTFACSCPDWAKLCKHVAAALYGVGVRLDARPELLFTLRGVDQHELVGSAARATAAVATATATGTPGRKLLDERELGAIFGIQLEGAPPLVVQSPTSLPGRAAAAPTPKRPRRR